MLKFSPSLLLLALTLGNTDAFGVKASPSLSNKIGTTQTSASASASASALFATVEKTGLKAPSDIPDDDVPALFEKYVQKTYG
jgi:hypothetical protein